MTFESFSSSFLLSQIFFFPSYTFLFLFRFIEDNLGHMIVDKNGDYEDAGHPNQVDVVQASTRVGVIFNF